MRLSVLWLILPTSAFASWPEDITLSGMTDQGGLPVADTAQLSADYQQLVAELGTAIANKPVPAQTLGIYGWSFDLSNHFILNEATARQGQISPWERAHSEEDPALFQNLPTFSFRKGLPFSTEVGLSIGWHAMSRQTAVSGFGRIGLLEGYKPWPDISLQLGYSGYVGNDELELGALDFGITIGSTYAFGQESKDVNTSRFQPYLNYTLVTVTAYPTIDEDTAFIIGAVPIRRRGTEDTLPAQRHHRIAGGFTLISGSVHFTVAGTWIPTTIPTAQVGTGVTF